MNEMSATHETLPKSTEQEERKSSQAAPLRADEMGVLTQQVEGGDSTQQQQKQDFTEVFSWGSDRFGQLGLGKQVSTQRQIHTIPRFCSYNIPIIQVACGTSHSIFITAQQLVYGMGSNAQGQLGIEDPYTQQKSSPVLIEGLVSKKSPITQQALVVHQVACGSTHSLALMKNGEVYSWGNNEHGQCGTGKEPFQQMIQWGPQMVKLDSYHNPLISQVSAGSAHSALVDEIGRLFMTGRGESGQLGNMSYTDEASPYYVQKIPDKVLEVACGEDHTLVLTKQEGEVYVMGSNQRGQLGIGGPSRGSNVPVLLAELSFTKILRVRAGAFSAAMSADQQLYLWGTGSFGQFYTPHRVKSVTKFDMVDFHLGRAGFITVLTRGGEVYTWGTNDAGQLGLRDTIARSTPHRVEALANKKVTQLACGRDFIIALGLTLPHTELEALNKRKKMIDEASKINQETRETVSKDHKRSSSKNSMKLRKEYDTSKQNYGSNNSIERMKSPSAQATLSNQKTKKTSARVKSALNINNATLSKQSMYNGLPITSAGGGVQGGPPTSNEYPTYQDRRASSSSHNQRTPVVMQAAPARKSLNQVTETTPSAMERTPISRQQQISHLNDLNEDSTNREAFQQHQRSNLGAEQRSQGSYYYARDRDRDAEEIMIQNLPEQLGSSLVMDYTPLRDSSEKKLVPAGCSLRSKSHGKSRRPAAGVHGYLGDGSTQDLRIQPQPIGGGGSVHSRTQNFPQPLPNQPQLPLLNHPSHSTVGASLRQPPPADPPTLLVTTLRKERDSLKHALDQELAHRRSLETDLESIRVRLHEQGLEVTNLRVSRDRADEEARAERQRLQSEYSSSQSRAVGEVEGLLRRARTEVEELKQRCELLEREGQKVKREGEVEKQRNLDMQRDQMQLMDLKKRLEGNLLDLSQEFERYRQTTNDQVLSEQSQVAALKAHLGELKNRYEETSNQLQGKMVELSDMVHEAERQRMECERFHSDNLNLREIVQDLEDKNRKLVEKLNQQILQRVTEYKEKALIALNRSDSPGKLRRAAAAGIADENRPPIDQNRSSPLKKTNDSAMAIKQQMQQVPSNYTVVRELEKIEVSNNKHYPESNPFSRRIDIQSDYVGVSSNGSPLRNRRQTEQTSPAIHGGSRQYRDELIDQNFRKARESCERIASVLGLNPSQIVSEVRQPSLLSTSPLRQSDVPSRAAYHQRPQSAAPVTQSLQNSHGAGQNQTFGQLPQVHLQNLAPQPQLHATSASTSMASSMVRQSLYELRQKLDQMRREKDAVEMSLSQYEERRSGYSAIQQPPR